MGRTIKHCWDTIFQEMSEERQVVLPTNLFWQCTKTFRAKCKMKSYMATTELGFSGHIQVVVCVKLWSPESSHVITAWCLTLQREILFVARPWSNSMNRLPSLTNSFGLWQSRVVTSDSIKRWMILSCDPARCSKIQQLQLSLHFELCLWKYFTCCRSCLLQQSV